MNALKHIRTKIFGLTQSEFAAIAGVTQASVSRWEGGVSPSLDDMRAIRAAAETRGVKWEDRFFFDMPEAAE